MAESTDAPGGRDRAAAEGHRSLVGQPHDSAVEGPVADAEATAARITSDARPLGPVGRRFNWRSPFFVGFAATAGVALTLGVIGLIWLAGPVLVLIGVALFLAIGMDPAVSWLVRHRLPRWLAVVAVILVIVAAAAGFIAAAVPPLVSEGQQLVADAPLLLQQVQDQNSFIGQLNEKFAIQDKITSLLSDSSSTIATGVIGAGQAIFGAVADALIIAVLTVYFLADMPRLRALAYRLVPHSRRPRAILIGDEIMAKVGGYVLGNLVISLIAGALTFVWLTVFHVPYPVLLSLLVAILDVVPVVGSTLAGLIVCAVALSVSVPVCIATIGFFMVYRFIEDYVLVPRIIGRAVRIPALVTVVAVLVGAALLGLVGALVAIPVSAALILLAREMLFPRLDAA